MARKPKTPREGKTHWFDARKRHVPHEHEEQHMFTEFLKCSGLLYTATPVRAFTTARQRAANTRGGYVSGAPDVMIFEPRGKYHGIMIEMKRRKGGRISPEQTDFLARLEARGYRACVAHGADEAKRLVQKYLGIPQTEDDDDAVER
jgi:hypothetical protein